MASARQMEVLRAFVAAHEVPYPDTTSRQPILLIRTFGGGSLKHHALDGDGPKVDDALLAELEGRGWLDIDQSGNAWKIAPTERPGCWSSSTTAS